MPGSLAEALDALEADHAFLLRGGVFTEDLIRTWIDWKREHEVDVVRLRPIRPSSASTTTARRHTMMKVEAVVVRDRIETVMDAVEEQTGHVGVTVIEAVGHGRQRGITHEYRGRVFESRFLPKALLTFVVPDGSTEPVIDDRRRGPDRARVGRRHLLGDAHLQRHAQPDGPEPGGGGGRMTNKVLAIAASTIWVSSPRSSSCSCRPASLPRGGPDRMKNVRPSPRRTSSSSGSRRSSTTSSASGSPSATEATASSAAAASARARTPCSRSARSRSAGSAPSRRPGRTSSRSSSRGSRSRSSGARWPSGRGSGSTSPSGSSSR